MPIETRRYCSHCTGQTGQLQSFEGRFERMTAWQARRNPGTPRTEIERQTLAYMALCQPGVTTPRHPGSWLTISVRLHAVEPERDSKRPAADMRTRPPGPLNATA